MPFLSLYGSLELLLNRGPYLEWVLSPEFVELLWCCELSFPFSQLVERRDCSNVLACGGRSLLRCDFPRLLNDHLEILDACVRFLVERIYRQDIEMARVVVEWAERTGPAQIRPTEVCVACVECDGALSALAVLSSSCDFHINGVIATAKSGAADLDVWIPTLRAAPCIHVRNLLETAQDVVNERDFDDVCERGGLFWQREEIPAGDKSLEKIIVIAHGRGPLTARTPAPKNGNWLDDVLDTRLPKPIDEVQPFLPVRRAAVVDRRSSKRSAGTHSSASQSFAIVLRLVLYDARVASDSIVARAMPVFSASS